jgi:hypothetical protein
MKIVPRIKNVLGGKSLKGTQHKGILSLQLSEKINFNSRRKQIFKKELFKLTQGKPLPEIELKKLAEIAARTALSKLKTVKKSSVEIAETFLKHRQNYSKMITETNEVHFTDPGNELYHNATSRKPHLVLNEVKNGKLIPRYAMEINKEFPSIQKIQRLRTQTVNGKWSAEKERIEAEKFSQTQLNGLHPEDVLLMEYIMRNKEKLKRHYLSFRVGNKNKKVYERIIKQFFKNPEKGFNSITYELDLSKPIVKKLLGLT